jgi:hypothetical protein
MMLSCQDRSREVIEAKLTVTAPVFLAKWIGILVSVLFDTIRSAFWAAYSMGPSLLSEKIVALTSVNKIMNADIQLGCGPGNHDASFRGKEKP